MGAAVRDPGRGAREGLLSGLILASAWADLPELAAEFFPRWLVNLTLGDRYDSVAAARELSCPVLVLHGRSDKIIAIAHGRRLYEALPPGARWLELQGAGHNDLLDQPDVWTEIADFVDYLR
ncbi:MAG: alpha/beta hydrolase [Thermoanaerobaculia bacterium]|nr:alpha/beta hydrolase [Thermoanaerobaculia bacterium]